jgi:hypothetical protein
MRTLRRLVYALKTTFSLFNLKRKAQAVQNELDTLLTSTNALPVPRNRAERRAFARKGLL